MCWTHLSHKLSLEMTKHSLKAYKFKGEEYSSKPCWRDQINWQACTAVWSLIAWGFLCHCPLSFLTAYSLTDSFAFWGSVFIKGFGLVSGQQWVEIHGSWLQMLPTFHCSLLSSPNWPHCILLDHKVASRCQWLWFKYVSALAVFPAHSQQLLWSRCQTL